MWHLLIKINKNLLIAIPLMMTAGFLFGIAFEAAFLTALILPATFIMIYPMMVTLNFKKLLEMQDKKTQLLTQALNFAVFPFIALLIGRIFFADHAYIALGLFLASLLPTSGMTISWTAFAKGNVEAAVKMTVIGLTLGSIATPFYLKWFMGTVVHINLLSISKQIALIVFIPMLLGYITRCFFLKKTDEKFFKEKIAPRFSSISTIGVLCIVFIAVSLKAKSIYNSPDKILLILIPLVVLYLLNYLISTAAGKLLLPREDGIALVYGTVMRNLSIALAIAINSFGEIGADAALVISLAYIVQVQSAAWYVKFTDSIWKCPAQ